MMPQGVSASPERAVRSGHAHFVQKVWYHCIRGLGAWHGVLGHGMLIVQFHVNTDQSCKELQMDPLLERRPRTWWYALHLDLQIVSLNCSAMFSHSNKRCRHRRACTHSESATPVRGWQTEVSHCCAAPRVHSLGLS
jgi:hypothetical protein